MPASELENFVLRAKVNFGSETSKVIQRLDAEAAHRKEMQSFFAEKHPVIQAMHSHEFNGPNDDPVGEVFTEKIYDNTPAREFFKAFDPYADDNVLRPEKTTLADGTVQAVSQLKNKPIIVKEVQHNFEGLYSGRSLKGPKPDFSLDFEKNPTMQRGELSLEKFDFEEDKTVLETEVIREDFKPEDTELSLKDNL